MGNFPRRLLKHTLRTFRDRDRRSRHQCCEIHADQTGRRPRFVTRCHVQLSDSIIYTRPLPLCSAEYTATQPGLAFMDPFGHTAAPSEIYGQAPYGEVSEQHRRQSWI